MEYSTWRALIKAEEMHLRRMLASVPWAGVYGFRKVTDKLSEGPVYVRSGFSAMDENAGENVYKPLSGKKQEAKEQD